MHISIDSLLQLKGYPKDFADIARCAEKLINLKKQKV